MSLKLNFHCGIVAAICLLIYSNTNAQQQDTSITIQRPGFWSSDFVKGSIAPVTLFTASALTWGERKEIRTLRNRYIPTFRKHYDDYLQYVPALSVFGLNAAGVKGKHTMKRAFMSYVFSVGVMVVAVNGIKYTAKVERPSGNEFNSFPSGHTANSFMNATFLHKEYGQYRHPLFSVAGYTMATATAVGRQLNNRHWISDVLAGAGIGILSTEVGYFIADKIYKGKGERAPLRNNPFPINNQPSFIEMRLGFAQATSKDLTSKATDIRAKKGFNMALEGAWFFHKHVGIGGEFSFTSFPMNDDNLAFPDPDVNTVSTGHYTQPMGIRYLGLGPYFSVPLPQNWFITAKANIGSSVGAQGFVQLQLEEEYEELFGSKELPYLRYKPETSFGWSAGIGVQKRIARNLGIKAFGSYFDSDHDFEVDIIESIDANGQYTYRNLGTEKVKFNHLTIGLALTAFLW